MTLEEKIETVARWIIEESDETFSEVEYLLSYVYKEKSSIDEDFGVLWEDITRKCDG